MTDGPDFSALGVPALLCGSLARMGAASPTPAQRAAIPAAARGGDIAVVAATGTGKTLAYLVPVAMRLLAEPPPRVRGRPVDPRRRLRALVLCPTRELAQQVAKEAERLFRGTVLRATAVYGKSALAPQRERVEDGIDLLVGTPGRVRELCELDVLSLAFVQQCVLDEADRMLDMGFLPDVKRVIAQLPPKRQTLFFSATMPPDIRQLADRLLVSPAVVSVAPPATTAERITQHLYFVHPKAKPGLLVELLAKNPEMRHTLVFTRTKHGANRLVGQLEKAGIAAAAIHGNKSQNARDRAMGAFRSGELRLLVATDIAARGIDVDGLSHVVNYDLPNVPETYVHRIGRTGRAGAEGIAISFCTDEERPYLASIEKLIRVKLERRGEIAAPPGLVETPEPARPAMGSPRPGAGHGGGGHRGRRHRGPRAHDERGRPHAR